MGIYVCTNYNGDVTVENDVPGLEFSLSKQKMKEYNVEFIC